MTVPTFEKDEEIIEIIELLFKERGDLFDEMSIYIKPEMFAAGLRTDKNAPPKQKHILKIEGIKGVRSILTDKKFLISGYMDKWQSLPQEKKIAAVAHVLKRVAFPSKAEMMELQEKGHDYPFGKLVRPDVEDFSTFIKALGVGWGEEGKVIPNIAEDKTITI